MTVSNQSSRVSAIGTGNVGQNIPFSFPVSQSSEVIVLKRITATGVETTLTETTNYTIVINGNIGGSITMVTAIATTEEIHIYRETPTTQILDLQPLGNFNADNIEEAFDKLTRRVIDNADRIERAIKLPQTDAIVRSSKIPNSIDRASKVISFDSDGNITSTFAVPAGSVSFSTVGTNIAEAADAGAVKVLLNLDHVFDVRDYGAVGDGTTDDSTAINLAGTAINAAGGGTLFFPDGTYVIDAEILLYDNMHITGEANAILKVKDDVKTNIVSATNKSNILIHKLIFDGNQANESSFVNDGDSWNCVYLYNGTNITIDDCTMKNVMGRGINALGTKRSRFTNNHISTTFDTDGSQENGGIQLHSNFNTSPNTIPIYNVVSGNHVEGFETGGIHVRGAHKNIVSNNVIVNCSDGVGRAALTLYDDDQDDGCFDNVVEGNVIDTGVFAINISAKNVGPARNIISNNTFQNISNFCITCTGPDNNISGNIMVDGIESGIKINGDDGNIITGNNIKTVTTSIEIRDNSNNTIITNNFLKGGASGLVLAALSTNSIVTGNLLKDSTDGITDNGGTSHLIRNNAFVNVTNEFVTSASRGSGHSIDNNIGVAIPSLANNATPPVNFGNTYLSGGTTAITDFDDGHEGQVIRIIAEHAITITDGTNIFLKNNTNFAMQSGDTLTLIQKADTFWYEVNRSHNTSSSIGNIVCVDNAVVCINNEVVTV